MTTQKRPEKARRCPLARMLAVACTALLLLTSCSIAEDILYGTLDVLEQSLMDEDEVANESLSADALTETVGYGAETVYVDPTEAQTLRYWRNTLKSDGERAAYDRIVEIRRTLRYRYRLGRSSRCITRF